MRWLAGWLIVVGFLVLLVGLWSTGSAVAR